MLSRICPYTDIHRAAEIAEKSFWSLVVSTKRDIEREFFSTGYLCYLVCSRPLSPKTRIVNVIKKDKPIIFLCSTQCEEFPYD